MQGFARRGFIELNMAASFVCVFTDRLHLWFSYVTVLSFTLYVHCVCISVIVQGYSTVEFVFAYLVWMHECFSSRLRIVNFVLTKCERAVWDGNNLYCMVDSIWAGVRSLLHFVWAKEDQCVWRITAVHLVMRVCLRLSTSSSWIWIFISTNFAIWEQCISRCMIVCDRVVAYVFGVWATRISQDMIVWDRARLATALRFKTTLPMCLAYERGASRNASLLGIVYV
jgi:hypothetical protein